VSFERAPEQEDLKVAPGPTWFVQVTGAVSGSVAASLHLFQYGEGRAPIKERVGPLPRVFHRIRIDPSTTALRLVLRITGKGTLRLDRIALHRLAG
jgi:hypothetical protein